MTKQSQTVGQQMKSGRALGLRWRQVFAWEADAEPLDVATLQRIARLLETRFVIQ